MIRNRYQRTQIETLVLFNRTQHHFSPPPLTAAIDAPVPAFRRPRQVRLKLGIRSPSPGPASVRQSPAVWPPGRHATASDTLCVWKASSCCRTVKKLRHQATGAVTVTRTVGRSPQAAASMSEPLEFRRPGCYNTLVTQ